MEPFKQYGAFTSETAKAMGKAANVSPARIEHVVRGLTANLGMTALMLSDQVLRAAGDYPELPDTPWSQAPVAKVFFSRSPNDYNRQITEFYDTLTEIRRKAQTLRALEKDGVDEDARDFEVQPETQRAFTMTLKPNMSH